MNGRVFDYNVGRFFGVDPFVQFPLNSQSLNPYSYILNNPLSGTDPTGYRSVCDVGSDGGNENGCGIVDNPGGWEPPKKDGMSVDGSKPGADGTAGAGVGSSNGSQTAQATSGAAPRKSEPTRPETNGTDSPVVETIEVVGSRRWKVTYDMQALYQFWKAIPIGQGFSSNQEVRAAGIRVNNSREKTAGDVEMTAEQIAFANRFAKPNFDVQSKINSEKGELESEFFLQLKIGGGEEEILDAARVSQGGALLCIQKPI